METSAGLWESDMAVDVDVDLDPVLAAPNLDEALRRLDRSIRSATATRCKEWNDGLQGTLQSTALVMEAEKTRAKRLPGENQDFLYDEADFSAGSESSGYGIIGDRLCLDMKFIAKPKAHCKLLYSTPMCVGSPLNTLQNEKDVTDLIEDEIMAAAMLSSSHEETEYNLITSTKIPASTSVICKPVKAAVSSNLSNEEAIDLDEGSGAYDIDNASLNQTDCPGVDLSNNNSNSMDSDELNLKVGLPGHGNHVSQLSERSTSAQNLGKEGWKDHSHPECEEERCDILSIEVSSNVKRENDTPQQKDDLPDAKEVRIRSNILAPNETDVTLAFIKKVPDQKEAKSYLSESDGNNVHEALDVISTDLKNIYTAVQLNSCPTYSESDTLKALNTASNYRKEFLSGILETHQEMSQNDEPESLHYAFTDFENHSAAKYLKRYPTESEDDMLNTLDIVDTNFETVPSAVQITSYPTEYESNILKELDVPFSKFENIPATAESTSEHILLVLADAYADSEGSPVAMFLKRHSTESEDDVLNALDIAANNFETAPLAVQVTSYPSEYKSNVLKALDVPLSKFEDIFATAKSTSEPTLLVAVDDFADSKDIPAAQFVKRYSTESEVDMLKAFDITASNFEHNSDEGVYCQNKHVQEKERASTYLYDGIPRRMKRENDLACLENNNLLALADVHLESPSVEKHNLYSEKSNPEKVLGAMDNTYILAGVSAEKEAEINSFYLQNRLIEGAKDRGTMSAVEMLAKTEKGRNLFSTNTVMSKDVHDSGTHATISPETDLKIDGYEPEYDLPAATKSFFTSAEIFANTQTKNDSSILSSHNALQTHACLPTATDTGAKSDSFDSKTHLSHSNITAAEYLSLELTPSRSTSSEIDDAFEKLVEILLPPSEEIDQTFSAVSSECAALNALFRTIPIPEANRIKLDLILPLGGSSGSAKVSTHDLERDPSHPGDITNKTETVSNPETTDINRGVSTDADREKTPSKGYVRGVSSEEDCAVQERFDGDSETSSSALDIRATFPEENDLRSDESTLLDGGTLITRRVKDRDSLSQGRGGEFILSDTALSAFSDNNAKKLESSLHFEATSLLRNPSVNYFKDTAISEVSGATKSVPEGVDKSCGSEVSGDLEISGDTFSTHRFKSENKQNSLSAMKPEFNGHAETGKAKHDRSESALFKDDLSNSLAESKNVFDKEVDLLTLQENICCNFSGDRSVSATSNKSYMAKKAYPSSGNGGERTTDCFVRSGPVDLGLRFSFQCPIPTHQNGRFIETKSNCSLPDDTATLVAARKVMTRNDDLSHEIPACIGTKRRAPVFRPAVTKHQTITDEENSILEIVKTRTVNASSVGPRLVTMSYPSKRKLSVPQNITLDTSSYLPSKKRLTCKSSCIDTLPCLSRNRLSVRKSSSLVTLSYSPTSGSTSWESSSSVPSSYSSNRPKLDAHIYISTKQTISHHAESPRKSKDYDAESETSQRIRLQQFEANRLDITEVETSRAKSQDSHPTDTIVEKSFSFHTATSRKYHQLKSDNMSAPASVSPTVKVTEINHGEDDTSAINSSLETCTDALPCHFFRSLERSEGRKTCSSPNDDIFSMTMGVPHRRAFWDNKLTDCNESKSDPVPKRHPSIRVPGIVQERKETFRTLSTTSEVVPSIHATQEDEHLREYNRQKFQEVRCFFENLRSNGDSAMRRTLSLKGVPSVKPRTIEAAVRTVAPAPEENKIDRHCPATVAERFNVTDVYRDVLGDGAAKTAAGTPLRGVPRRKAVVATLDSFRTCDFVTRNKKDGRESINRNA